MENIVLSLSLSLSTKKIHIRYQTLSPDLSAKNFTIEARGSNYAALNTHREALRWAGEELKEDSEKLLAD